MGGTRKSAAKPWDCGSLLPVVRSKHPRGEEFQARIALEVVVRKHENAAPQTYQPSGLQVMGGERRGDTQLPERLDVERSTPREFCLEHLE